VDGRFTRSPFQIFILLLCILAGYNFVVNGEGSDIIKESMKEFYVKSWGTALIIGAILSLLGSMWRGKLDTGLLIERSGLYAMGGMAIIYGVLILLFAGTDASLAALTTAGFGGFCFAQVRYINKVINTYITQLEAHGNTKQ
jgi:hypothetical protein